MYRETCCTRGGEALLETFTVSGTWLLLCFKSVLLKNVVIRVDQGWVAQTVINCLGRTFHGGDVHRKYPKSKLAHLNLCTALELV